MTPLYDGEHVSIGLDVETGVARIRLHQPPVNALNGRLRRELMEAVGLLRDTESARAAVVWGGPDAFAAGADLKEMMVTDPGDTRLSDTLRRALLALEQVPKATIAAVAGPAIGGGCELALACDFRFADPEAKFGLPEVRLGLMPGAGGTQRLPRLIGTARAKELMYSGRIIGAAEALEIGLIDRIVAPGDVHRAAVETATGYARGGTALGSIKEAVREGMQRPLEDGLTLERSLFTRCRRSGEAQRRIERFVNKAH
ncbi:MAG: enoyl-CoA hydratase/isomerase family protein [Actinophytocola sp.]|uniref:enoyl-CoA hydratase/isomerase family protein n=1 Tax=Actinophytocola sp. TaxID=1872138 RepID=UPI00132A20CC|nr:enoyl-CoA hydratase/isomerase family protein [Actinophytocola sp.]MPZ80083.1 enoyl-CoA hydratase/isomerase family protein [Actinophytocola sp.]